MVEEHGTGDDNEPNPGYLMRTPSHQPESYAIRSFTGAGVSDAPSVGSYMSDWIDETSYLDRRSRQSVKSNDDESFHTAFSNDPGRSHSSSPPTGQDLETMELYDHYDSESICNSDTDGNKRQ